MTKLVRSNVGTKHRWVSVVNPLNRRAVLQACDGCGVVKSENSTVKSCKAATNVALISGAMASSLYLVSDLFY